VFQGGGRNAPRIIAEENAIEPPRRQARQEDAEERQGGESWDLSVFSLISSLRPLGELGALAVQWPSIPSGFGVTFGHHPGIHQERQFIEKFAVGLATS
jgi:hypothetical protein